MKGLPMMYNAPDRDTGGMALPNRRKPAAMAQQWKLLLVEDNEDLALSQRLLLEDLGYRVLVASSASAEAAFDQFEPDGVLLHLGHPNSPRLDLARRFRAADSDVRIVGITAWGVDTFAQPQSMSDALDALAAKEGPIEDILEALKPLAPPRP